MANRWALVVMAATVACGSSGGDTQVGAVLTSGQYDLEYQDASGSCAYAAGGYVDAYDAAVDVSADESFSMELTTSDEDADARVQCPAQSDGQACSGSWSFDTITNVGGEDIDATLTWTTTVSNVTVLTEGEFDLDLSTEITCAGEECDQSDIAHPCVSTQTYRGTLTAG